MLREFLIAGPKLFGAVNHERLAWQIAAMFDHELANPDSVFAQKPGESIINRLESLRLMGNARGVNMEAFQQWFGTVQLCAMSCAIAKGEAKDENLDREGIRQDLESRMSIYPEMTAMLSPAQASAMTFWEN